MQVVWWRRAQKTMRGRDKKIYILGTPIGYVPTQRMNVLPTPSTPGSWPFVWDIAGACPLLIAYTASLQPDYNSAPNPWLHSLVVAAVVSLSLWVYPLPSVLQTASTTVCNVCRCTMDLTVLFILGQGMSLSSQSPTYIQPYLIIGTSGHDPPKQQKQPMI